MDDYHDIIEVTAPLWGAFLDGSEPQSTVEATNDFYKIDSGIVIYYPSIQEINIIKKSSIVNVNTVIPAHLKLIFQGRTLGDIHKEALDLIKDAVYSLRLYKYGWFLNPLFSEIVFNAGFNIQRLPGHYRQAFYYDIQKEPERHYQYGLSKDDFLENSDLLSIFQLLRAYRLSPNTSVDIALENFNNSFGYQTRPKDELNFLFTTLDACMGGMSASRIGNTRLRAWFVNRLRSIVDYAKLPITEEEIRWFDDGRAGGRYIRNGLAHGTLNIEITEDIFIILHKIIGYILLEYINFCVHYTENPDLFADNFDISTANSFCAIFNKIIDECIRDDGKKQIMTDIAFNKQESD